MRGKLVILLLAIVLALPAYADATWGAKGMREPDTKHDTQDHFMWLDPATSGNKVYFNAFTSQSIGAHAEVGSSLNPNFATVGSERQSWNGRMIAMLGVWLDCNGDGFVGWGDNALFEYRADLLVGPYNTHICPVDARFPAGGTASYNFIPPHNDGQWVREFIPIGPDLNAHTIPDANPWDLHDAGARVWVDWGAPGSIPPTTRCYAFAPENSFHTTGGLLQYADCFDGFAVTDSIDTIADATGNPGGVSFSDAPREQFKSHSTLNMQNPWGETDSGSDVYVWDCGHAALTPHEQVNSVYGFQVSQPNTNVANSINTGGSIASTVEETAAGADDCSRTNQGNDNQWEHQVAHEIYAQETEGTTITNGGGKQQTDFVLSYQEGQRPPLAAASAATNNIGRATSKDAGLRATETEGFYLGTTIIGEDRNPYTNREVVKQGSLFAPVQYVTAYALLTQLTGLEFPPGNAPGVYGAENCGTHTTDVWNGWKCDPTKWWPGNCAGGYHCCVPGNGYGCTGTVDGVSSTDISVSVGQSYNLRDVDCYDTSVQAARDVGVGYGVLTQTNCE